MFFSIKKDDGHRKYFQLIAYDFRQLNSDVIRAFAKEYSIDESPKIPEIIKGEVEFYAHCVTKWGVKFGYWEKVGSNTDVGALEHILFRDTNDYGSRPGEQIAISHKWYVWRINDKDFTEVGELEGENRKAEIGVVISPPCIVHRMQTGEYDFVYPGFE